ncbi:hypothetical protein BDV96DRAFT_614028 [Lophiotrema nucula]|uniref:Copper acquisition factor BIM1-like domain-containing protein n=1 Tax=Lophiotrema nucula TaxID=690887 RepID=A0A6A5Z131_9PLEO|nr:hypothetical protein BDV96DRAFT_614028 [Lophiotrema nucula]
MHFYIASAGTLLSVLAHAQQHGEDAEGTKMGPVAFLWPSDRNWTAAADNIGPCGSPGGVMRRTTFPLSQGSVALSIADEAWNIAFRVAYANNPLQQAQFSDQVVSNISEIAPGHQCYKLDQFEDVSAGTNATIQLEYWSEYEGENKGNNQSFFACADITFVEAKDFTIQVPCFNVTSDDFNAPTPSTSSTLPSATDASQASQTAAASSLSASSSSSSLSAGAKAGIAVGSIVGGVAITALVAFIVWRRGKATGLANRNSYELRAKNLSTTPEGASATSCRDNA